MDKGIQQVAGSMWAVVRRYHIHLLVIGVIRIVAGQKAAGRYIDRL